MPNGEEAKKLIGGRFSVVTTTITSIQFPPGEAGERRRPGRAEYVNRHLIALLRGSVGAAPGPGDQPAETEDQDKLGLDPDEAALLSGTVSLFDGACQMGSPDPIINQERNSEGGRCSPDDFLADQVSYVADVSIATASGVAIVKDLTVGEVVLTPSGKRRVIRTRLFSLNPASEPLPELAAPVLIRRHAIAPGLPGEDLWLSSTHCLVIENQLVPVRLVVNGLTVVQDLETPSVQYCQVLFDRPVREHPILSSDDAAPIRRRMRERAEGLGYDWASPGGTADLGLHLLMDGKPVLPSEIHGARRSFVVPFGDQLLQLAAQYDAAVLKIEIITQNEYHVIPADHPGLLLGWGPFQREGNAIWRCIIGPATLPTRPTVKAAMIVVHLNTSAPRAR